MNITKNARRYSIIAATCFLIFGAYSLINTILYANLRVNYLVTFLNVFNLVIWFSFCVFVFLGKKNLGLVGVAAALTLCQIISYLLYNSLIGILPSIVLFFVILLTTIPSLRTNAKIVKYIWYIPAVLLLFNLRSRIWDLGDSVLGLLFALVEVVAYLFFGLWLKEDIGSSVNYEDTNIETDNKINTLFLQIGTIVVLVLGFVISLIVFMFMTEAGDSAFLAGMLMVYFLALCIPIVYIIFVLSKKKIEPARNLAMVIIFAFLFQWAYYPIWIYQTSSAIKTSSKLKPFTHVFLCMFIPFYSIYWVNIHSKAMYQKFIANGKHTTDFSTLHTIVYFFVPFVGVALLQSKINEFYNPIASIPYSYASPNVTQPEQANCEQYFNEESIADKLKNLKELMDQGIITSEDYEAKKKELLTKI